MRYCVNCGEKLEENIKFCPGCGSRIYGHEYNTDKPEKSRRGFTILILLIAVIVSAAVAAGTVFFVFRGGSSAEKTVITEPDRAVQEEEDVAPPSENAAEEQEAQIAPEAEESTAATEESTAEPEEAVVVLPPEEQFAAVQRDAIFSGFGLFPAAADGEIPSLPVIDTGLTVRFKIKDAPMLINSSSMSIKLLLDPEGTSIVDANFRLGGFIGISGLVSYGGDRMGLELFGKYYTITMEELVKIIAEKTGEDIDTLTAEAIDSQTAAEEIAKLFDIMLGIANSGNVSREYGSVELEYVGGKIECESITCRPGADELETVLKKLSEYLLRSETVKTIAENGDADEIITALKRLYTNAGEYAAEMAEDNFAWTVVFDSDKIYEISIGTDSDAVIYQFCGSEKGGRISLLERYFYNGKEYNIVALSGEYTLSADNIKGSLVFGENDAVVRFNLSLSEKSGLFIPYGSVNISADGIELSFNTAASGKKGSMHTLSIAEGGQELIQLSIESSDSHSGAKLPSTAPTVVTASNVDELIGEIERILDYFN